MTDLILAGGDIVTLDPRRPAASAVAITGGRITAVGDHHDIRQWRGNRTEVIDLGGATLTPGLTDSHMHPAMGLNLTAGVDLSACASLGSVRAALNAAAAAAGPDQWILGWGLDPNSFGTTPIGSDAIEDALGGRPACLNLFDGHSVIASRAGPGKGRDRWPAPVRLPLRHRLRRARQSHRAPARMGRDPPGPLGHPARTVHQAPRPARRAAA